MMLPAKGYGRSTGSCGELVQGFLRGGKPFHVTCPIDRFTEVEVRLLPAQARALVGFGPSTEKMRLACERTLIRLRAGPAKIAFTRRSGLEPGKGMASSTADIVAVARAIASALGKGIDSSTLAEIAASIERSDGIMYEGLNAVDHVTGERIKAFAWYPQYTILMCVPPDSFETSHADLSIERECKPSYDGLLDALDEASREQNSRTFSEVCSESARLNQRYRFNPLFALIEKHLRGLGAEGACVGHTGTVVGLLFAGTDASAKAEAAKAPLRRLLPKQVRIEKVSLHITVSPQGELAGAGCTSPLAAAGSDPKPY